jgi:hypothetical protein
MQFMVELREFDLEPSEPNSLKPALGVPANIVRFAVPRGRTGGFIGCLLGDGCATVVRLLGPPFGMVLWASRNTKFTRPPAQAEGMPRIVLAMAW